MPTAPSAIAIATTIRPMRMILTSSTWTDGVRSVARVIRLSTKLLAMLVSHSATSSSAPALIRSSGVSRKPPITIANESSVSDRRIELAEDAQRRDEPCRYRHQLDDEGVADHRGHEPDHEPRQRQLGGDHQQVAAARPGRRGTSRRARRSPGARTPRSRRCRPARGRNAAAAAASASPARSCRPARGSPHPPHRRCRRRPGSARTADRTMARRTPRRPIARSVAGTR